MNVRATMASAALVSIVALSQPDSAPAQDLGAFQWQLDPYCNVITLRATQRGNVFDVAGWDDGSGTECNGPRFLGVFGDAFVNPDGTVGLTFTTIYPPEDAGTANWFHTYVTLDPGTLSGTWVDDVGDSGDFSFLGAAPSTAAERSETAGPIGPSRPRK